MSDNTDSASGVPTRGSSAFRRRSAHVAALFVRVGCSW